MITIEQVLKELEKNDQTIRRQQYMETLDVAKMMQVFNKIGNIFIGNYSIDSNNFACVENLIKWTFGDSTMKAFDPNTRKVTPGNLRKGIYLYGPTGTGKTLCMEILSRMAFMFGLAYMVGAEKRRFEWQNARTDDIVDRFSHGESLAEYKRMPIVCFHDLGSESEESIYMGNRVNVMRTIIEQRGDRRDCMTLFTSNIPINSPDLVSKYGDRAVSRLVEMCNLLALGGPDRRKKK